MSTQEKDRVESMVSLPSDIVAEARRAALAAGTTFDELVADALAARLAALEQDTYFDTRKARATAGRGIELLRRAGAPGTAGRGDDLP